MTTKELEKKLKISKKTCIHCPTLELAKQVLNIFHRLGLKWCNEEHYNITCTKWDSFKENTVYYPFEGEFSSLNYARLQGYKIINAEEFIALHIEGAEFIALHRREELIASPTEGKEFITLPTEEEEFDLENYEPKGELEGFPKEIIARMLECQEEQWNKIDVSVFERDKTAGETAKGIFWSQTKEGFEFWNDVIDNKNFNFFFEKYPKQDYQEPKTAKYVQVGDNAILSDYTSTQSSVEIEINTTEDKPQEFKVGEEVFDIILGQKGKILQISTDDNSISPICASFNGGKKTYALDGRHHMDDKYPRLLHYRDDYDYDVIDFNNLPKRQDKRWRAEEEGVYYFVNFYTKDWFFPDKSKDDHDYHIDNDNYNSGNYFRTEVVAQEVADKLNKYFQELIQHQSQLKIFQ